MDVVDFIIKTSTMTHPENWTIINDNNWTMINDFMRWGVLVSSCIWKPILMHEVFD